MAKMLTGAKLGAFLAVVAGSMFLAYTVTQIVARKKKRPHGQGGSRDAGAQGSDDPDVKVSVLLHDSGKAQLSVDDDYPKAPPPTRNTSDLDLNRLEDEGDEYEEEETLGVPGRRRKKRAKTPPPSRSSNLQMALEEEFIINDMGEVEGQFLQLPLGGGDACSPGDPSSQSSTPGSKGHQSLALTEEVAAAMSLSLGAQGFTQTEEGEDVIDQNGCDEEMTSVKTSLLSQKPPSGESLDTRVSDLKLVDAISSDSAINTNQNANPSMNSEDHAQSETKPIPKQKASADTPVTKEDIRDTFMLFETQSWQKMTVKHANVLSTLMTSDDPELQSKVLQYTGNAGSFTRNQNLLREAGCLPKLGRLLRAHNMALRVGQGVSYPSVIQSTIHSISNLAVNHTNQSQLQECIPALIDFATSSDTPEAVQLSSLQALTNLSVTSDYHAPYTQIIQHLYESLDYGSPSIQNQALKVLVNLSSNTDMVPHLLAAKAPNCLLALLVPTVDEDLITRWMNLLANVMGITREQGITSESLPTEYKAASPETMFTALYGVSNSVRLRSKVFVLSKHHNQDIRYHAARIYSCLV